MQVFARSLRLSVLAAIIAAPLLIWWKYEAVIDWWRLRDYTPSPAVVHLADATTMTDPGRRIFYVNHPRIHTDSENFRKDCPRSEQTIVLGCYYSPQMGIAVYDVSDPRLNGVEEVTAAHEMLHAAYDRLGADEKQRINSLLQSVYSGLDNLRVKQTVDTYGQPTDPDVINEMHSIFGTELASLPVELESHYSRYFKDRQAVVSLALGYEAEFNSRLEKAKELEARLNSMRLDIEAQEQNLERQAAELDAQRRTLDNLRSSGDISGYNSQVAGFNAKVNSYNQGVSRLRRDISQYNSLLEEYNSLAGELRSLYDAIDTRLAPKAAN